MDDESEIVQYGVKLMNWSLPWNVQEIKLKLEYYYSTIVSSNLWLFDRAKIIKINLYYNISEKIFPSFHVFTANFPKNTNKNIWF